MSLLLTAAIAFSPCTTAVFAAESQAQPAETAVTRVADETLVGLNAQAGEPAADKRETDPKTDETKTEETKAEEEKPKEEDNSAKTGTNETGTESAEKTGETAAQPESQSETAAAKAEVNTEETATEAKAESEAEQEQTAAAESETAQIPENQLGEEAALQNLELADDQTAGTVYHLRFTFSGAENASDAAKAAIDKIDNNIKKLEDNEYTASGPDDTTWYEKAFADAYSAMDDSLYLDDSDPENIRIWGPYVTGNDLQFDLEKKVITVPVVWKSIKPEDMQRKDAIELSGEIALEGNVAKEDDGTYLLRNPGDSFTFVGKLNVGSIKEQIDAIHSWAGRIPVTHIKSTFVATLTLPEGLDVTQENIGNVQLNDTSLFTVTKTEIIGKDVKVTMDLKGSYNNLTALKEAVDAAGGKGSILTVPVSGVKVSKKAKSGDTFTATGTVKGDFSGYAISGDWAVHVMYDWYANSQIKGTIRLPQISVKKEWKDADNMDQVRPDSVEVQLYADQTPVGNPVILNDDNAWSYTWPATAETYLTDDSGSRITYTVKETNAEDDYLEQDDPAVWDESSRTLQAVVTNTRKISVPVEKKWEAKTGPSVSVAAYSGEKQAGEAVVLNAGNQWKGTIDNLPKYDESGKKITYTVKETSVPEGYMAAVSGDQEHGFVITNTNVETIDISVAKKWVGKTGTEAQVAVFDGGRQAGNVITLTAAGGWKGTFKGLPRYRDNSEIQYKVKEIQVPSGYTSSVTGDQKNGFLVTNTNVETIDIPVEKKWVGKVGQAATVALYDGSTQIGDAIVLTAGTNWKGSFTGLQKYRDDAEIPYTVKEMNVPEGYKSSVSAVDKQDLTKGFVVTNTEIKKPSKPGKKETEKEKPDTPSIPDEAAEIAKKVTGVLGAARVPAANLTDHEKQVLTAAGYVLTDTDGDGVGDTYVLGGVKTGDTTPVLPYVLTLLAALGLFAAVLATRKRRNRS